eukprot:Selendium_serpulae@DN6512_c1_g1_i15.p1
MANWMCNLSRSALLLLSLATTGALAHDKAVIGYLTQWEAWKGQEQGFQEQGEANHLNIDWDIYNIINFSFFGVAKDGSLHSGDFRNKEIYKEEAVQEPNQLCFTDVYSSWDLHILWGELEYSYAFDDRSAAQGFVPWTDGNGTAGWKHEPTGLTNPYPECPIPLKADGGVKGLLEMGKEKGAKVMASLGGWSMSKHFPEVAATSSMKEMFLNECQRLIDMGFDGIDIDWEFPGAGGMNFVGTDDDFENFAKLMEDIRAKIGEDKLVTAAFSAATEKLEGHYWDRLSNVMDYFNMMTYDLNGGWSGFAGHNAPLHGYPDEEFPGLHLDNLRIFLEDKGVDLGKVNFGGAFYGRGIVTSDTTSTVGSPTVKQNVNFEVDGPQESAVDLDNWDEYEGSPNYNYIVNQAPSLAGEAGSNWVRHWDDSAKVPYGVDGKYFISYDDKQSITEKAQYIVNHGLGGIIVWQIHGDIKCEGSLIEHGPRLLECDNLSSPLAEAIGAVFSGDSNGGGDGPDTGPNPTPPPKPTTPAPAPKPTTPTTTSTTTTSTTTTSSTTKGSVEPGAPWDPTVEYLGGETVTHNGSEWVANWWNVNIEPGTTPEWTRVVDPNAGPQPWNAATQYNAGDKCTHEGSNYVAQWWTQGNAPGEPNSPWIEE